MVPLGLRPRPWEEPVLGPAAVPHIMPDPSKPDPSPEQPYIQNFSNEINDSLAQFQSAQQSVQVVRVWAFERFEGLRFDDSGSVIGLDSEFLVNITKVLDAAASKGLQIYLCLNFWSVYDGSSQDIVNSGRAADYLALQATWKTMVRKLLQDSDVLTSFINNALKPLVTSIGNYPALFAIDLMNEPELLTDKDQTITFNDLKNYLSRCSRVVKQTNSSVKISCGFCAFPPSRTTPLLWRLWWTFLITTSTTRTGRLTRMSLSNLPASPA